MNKYLFVIALVLVIASGCAQQATIAGHTQTESPQVKPEIQPPQPENSGKTEVLIQNFAFNPDTITIAKGTTILWTSLDSVPHLLGGDITSQKLQKGDTFSFTFEEAGTYNYHCIIHPAMTGTVIVK